MFFGVGFLVNNAKGILETPNVRQLKYFTGIFLIQFFVMFGFAEIKSGVICFELLM